MDPVLLRRVQTASQPTLGVAMELEKHEEQVSSTSVFRRPCVIYMLAVAEFRSTRLIRTFNHETILHSWFDIMKRRMNSEYMCGARYTMKMGSRRAPLFSTTSKQRRGTAGGSKENGTVEI
jgi:hypothetical protein